MFFLDLRLFLGNLSQEGYDWGGVLWETCPINGKHIWKRVWGSSKEEQSNVIDSFDYKFLSESVCPLYPLKNTLNVVTANYFLYHNIQFCIYCIYVT